MSTHKVSEIFVGAGAALSANNTALPSIAVQTGIVGSDMLTLNPAGGDTITTQPVIYLVNKYSDGTFKRSFPIVGTSAIGYKGEHYVPSRRCVWGIGYQRGSVVDGVTTAASGSITVANSTIYEFTIRFKNDKQNYSERPEVLSISFTSSAAATQSNIADQIVSAINNSAFGASVSGVKEIVAVKVGDGTGAYGLTGATNFGVEITGLTINQFQTSNYAEELVYFSVHVNDASGFGSGTAATQIQSVKYGTGTYNQVYNMENKFYGNEGVLNRTKWPVPALTFLASSTYVTSGNVAAAATTPTGNVTATINEDVVTVATATTGLRPGEIIDINGTQYEIKYVRSSTTFVTTAVQAATYSGANLKVKYLYNIFNIVVRDQTIQDGAGVGQFSQKSIFIATPAIDAAAADPFDRTLDSADTSAECLDILDILNGWMATTPLAPANVTLA